MRPKCGSVNRWLGAEAGYDTNVFFEKAAKGAPVIRIIPFLQLTNAQRGGAQPTGIFYDLSATLLYREFITDDQSAKAQRAFSPVIAGLVDFNPQGQLNFSVTDQFARLTYSPKCQRHRCPWGEGSHVSLDQHLVRRVHVGTRLVDR